MAGGQNAAASTGGCYDWPVIKQIVIFFGWIIEYIYKFFDMIGIANIGLVIIAFTLLIKLCLLPLTIKQQKFSKLTNIMQPELNAIRVKYTGRKDTESMQAMQDEQKAVYAKYGVSQMGGCLQTGIQMPVLIALYGALRQLPLLIDKLTYPLMKIVTLLNTSGIDFAALKINSVVGNLAVEDSVQMSVLYSLPIKGWTAITDAVSAVNPQMAAEEAYVSPFACVSLKDSHCAAPAISGRMIEIIPMPPAFIKFHGVWLRSNPRKEFAATICPCRSVISAAICGFTAVTASVIAVHPFIGRL